MKTVEHPGFRVDASRLSAEELRLIEGATLRAEGRILAEHLDSDGARVIDAMEWDRVSLYPAKPAD